MAYLAKFDPTLNDWRTTNTMNTKHTPGPWHVGRVATTQGQHFATTSPNGDHIATIGEAINSQNGSGNAYFNARLIAAAPELLEALKLALGDLEQAQAETHIDFLGSIDAARAAITKATGNTNL